MVRFVSKTLPTVLAALVLSACATPGPIVTENVGAMRTAVASTETETAAVFTDINAKARDDTIDRLVLSSTGPSESEFRPVIDTETAGRWAAAFDTTDSYLAGLQRLVDEGPSATITADLVAVGDTLQGDAIGAKLPEGTAGLFADLGGSIVQAAAEKEAQAIMRRTNPDFQVLTRRMADLVHPAAGGSELGTLRAIVGLHWNNRLTNIEADYRKVADGSAKDRRGVLERYGTVIDQRNDDLLRLRRLRQALLALGEAHNSAGQGNSSGALFWLDQLETQLDAAREEAAKER